MAPWVMHQAWDHLLFAHWEVDPARLRPLVPESLELDLWDGKAWIAIVPFLMTDVHGRLLPPLPGSGRFLETNVRTYVRRRGRPGIYFFSLDAASAPAVWVARTALRLPYRMADGLLEVDGDRRRYVIRRRDEGYGLARLDARYRPLAPTAEPAAGSLEEFLTERYRLFAEPRPGLVVGIEIDHPRWRVAPAEAELGHDGLLPTALGVTGPPQLLHVAERQSVHTWLPHLG